MTQSVELLAPAGTAAALHAAVRAGANAVYLGLDSFNARRGADNFTIDSLSEACDYAHLRGAKVYLTFNIAILPHELSDALETARQAWRAGVDAFIVQDLGVASELRRVLPQARVHISTQMNTHNVDGIAAAAQLGAKRVTLARECSLPEIERIAREAQTRGIEIETFAHGALCVCYSGQCFMSSMIGGRSANRGLCAQACRLPYSLHNVAQRKDLPSPGEHLLSPKDLCSVDLFPELINAGVSSLKIEGRMKSPEYVYAVTKVYRQVLDRVLSWFEDQGVMTEQDGPDGIDDQAEQGEQEQTLSEAQLSRAPRATDEERQALSEAFSRGFTQAYLVGQRGNDIMSYGRPNNRGVFVGRVARVKDGQALLACEKQLQVGDVLEFWTNKGHFAYTLDELKTDQQGNLVTHPDRAVGKGDRVFRVRSAAAAFNDDVHEPRVHVSGSIQLRLGEPLCMTVWPTAAPNLAARAFGPIVETARTKPVDAESIHAHVDRLGTSDYALDDLSIDLDEGVGIGFSQVHHVRAEALESLSAMLLQQWHERSLDKAPRAEKHAAVAPSKGISICVLATNPACAAAAKKAGADALYVPALNLGKNCATAAGQVSEGASRAPWPEEFTLVMPVVVREGVGSRENTQHFDAWSHLRAGQGVMAESLASLKHATDANVPVEVGPHIPATNASALEALASMGATRVWLSPELNLSQIQQIGKNTPLPLGITVSGQQELMTTEHCMLMSQGPCNEDCANCPRRKSPHYLRDRKGYEFPVVTDYCGRSHLYNSVPLDALHAVPDLVHAGVSAFMIDATLMNVEQTREAVSRLIRARSLANTSGAKLEKPAGTTGGHLFRGVQ